LLLGGIGFFGTARTLVANRAESAEELVQTIAMHEPMVLFPLSFRRPGLTRGSPVFAISQCCGAVKAIEHIAWPGNGTSDPVTAPGHGHAPLHLALVSPGLMDAMAA
jgi:hypothetical protein